MALDLNLIKQDVDSGKTLCLLFSGGSDSSTLMSIIDKLFSPTNLELYFVHSSPFYYPAALAIHQRYFSKYKFIEVPCPPDTEVIRPVIGAYLEEIGFKPETHVMYTAITKNPEIDIGGRPPVRMSQEEISNRPWVRAPFSQMTKSEVTALAKQYAPDGLLPMTQSCNRVQRHCGVCFPCLERAWAYKENGLDFKGNPL